MPKDEQLLKEIRENHEYALNYWREIREEGATDMRYISGDPWEPEEKKARKDANRPFLALDELNQYTNQLINDVRMNKRSVRVLPRGNGATDETAELRGGLIRQIEYKSNAQAAYCSAFEGAAQRGYGFARVSKDYVSTDSFDMELCIRRIPNPDTVLIDPDAKEADCSDMAWAFISEPWKISKYKERWPNAEVRSFDAELASEHPQWMRDEQTIQVAEYWRKESRRRTLVMVDDGSRDGMKAFLDQIPGAVLQDSSIVIPGIGTLPIARVRKVDDEAVVQYITNGLEKLEMNPWDGRFIPIGVCFGKEIYVDDGAGAKRKLMSLIRLARDPYMLYCYYRTCEMELAGMVPKTPIIGYEGQFEGHEDEWQHVGRIPIAYLQVKPMLDATGMTVLPLPQWNHWEPPIQALEVGAEAARRAIQAAVGMYNSSVGKRDSSGQSGVAIQKLDQQSSQGSYHFQDNYDRFLSHMGRMLDDLLDKTYDTARDVGIRHPDEEHEMIRINEPQTDPKTGEQTNHRTDEGDHDVTISVGPSYQSQRDEAADFANSLSQNQQVFPRIADLIVKLRNLGPIGDEIAKRLTPPDIAAEQNGAPRIPPQVKQQMDAMAQQHQALIETVHKLQDQLDQKTAELEVRKYIAEIQEETKRTIALAQINSKEGLAQLEQELQIIHNKLDQFHQADMQAAQQQHEQDQAAAAQQAAQQSAAQPQPVEPQVPQQ